MDKAKVIDYLMQAVPIKALTKDLTDKEHDEFREAIDVAVEALKQPEIIYCHECIHFQCNMRFDGSVPKGADAYECRRGCGGCDPMDYCSYGERAERRTE